MVRKSVYVSDMVECQHTGVTSWHKRAARHATTLPHQKGKLDFQPHKSKTAFCIKKIPSNDLFYHLSLSSGIPTLNKKYSNQGNGLPFPKYFHRPFGVTKLAVARGHSLMMKTSFLAFRLLSALLQLTTSYKIYIRTVSFQHLMSLQFKVVYGLFCLGRAIHVKYP